MLSKKRNNRINLKSRKHKKVSKSRKQNSRSKVSKTRKNILRGGDTAEPVYAIPHLGAPLPALPANAPPPPQPPPEVPDRSLKNFPNKVPVNLNTTTHVDPQNPNGNEQL